MKLIYPVILLLFASGCAFTQATLDVKYDQGRARRGPLSSIKPLRIQVARFEDKRPQTSVIGYKRTGWGTKAANVTTACLVTDIVREAIVAVLQKNGHIVTDEKYEMKISGAVETFWFEHQMNVLTLEFIGTIAVDLTLEDSQTNNSLLSKRYVGYHNAKLYSGYHKEMTQVMNSALEDLITQIATDTQLIEAIRPYGDQ